MCKSRSNNKQNNKNSVNNSFSLLIQENNAKVFISLINTISNPQIAAIKCPISTASLSPPKTVNNNRVYFVCVCVFLQLKQSIIHFKFTTPELTKNIILLLPRRTPFRHCHSFKTLHSFSMISRTANSLEKQQQGSGTVSSQASTPLTAKIHPAAVSLRREQKP